MQTMNFQGGMSNKNGANRLGPLNNHGLDENWTQIADRPPEYLYDRFLDDDCKIYNPENNNEQVGLTTKVNFTMLRQIGGRFAIYGPEKVNGKYPLLAYQYGKVIGYSSFHCLTLAQQDALIAACHQWVSEGKRLGTYISRHHCNPWERNIPGFPQPESPSPGNPWRDDADTWKHLAPELHAFSHLGITVLGVDNSGIGEERDNLRPIFEKIRNRYGFDIFTEGMPTMDDTTSVPDWDFVRLAGGVMMNWNFIYHHCLRFPDRWNVWQVPKDIKDAHVWMAPSNGPAHPNATPKDIATMINLGYSPAYHNSGMAVVV